MYGQVQCLRHRGSVLDNQDLRIAIRQVRRYREIKLVEPHESSRQTRIGNRSRSCSEEDADGVEQAITLSGDRSGQNRRGHVAEADAIGNDEIPWLGGPAVYAARRSRGYVQHVGSIRGERGEHVLVPVSIPVRRSKETRSD